MVPLNVSVIPPLSLLVTVKLTVSLLVTVPVKAPEPMSDKDRYLGIQAMTAGKDSPDTDHLTAGFPHNRDRLQADTGHWEADFPIDKDRFS